MSEFTPDETEVATVWQAQYGDGDAGVGKTLRREGEESWTRFIAKVKADALREAARSIQGTAVGSCNTGCHVSDMVTLQMLANRIEGEA